VLDGHVKLTGEELTVKVALQVIVSQSLIAVKVTVFAPPHAEGGPVLLFVNEPAVHPPELLTVVNHVAYFESIVA
jgi:hypothetical protein